MQCMHKVTEWRCDGLGDIVSMLQSLLLRNPDIKQLPYGKQKCQHGLRNLPTALPWSGQISLSKCLETDEKMAQNGLKFCHLQDFKSTCNNWRDIVWELNKLYFIYVISQIFGSRYSKSIQVHASPSNSIQRTLGWSVSPSGPAVIR